MWFPLRGYCYRLCVFYYFNFNFLVYFNYYSPSSSRSALLVNKISHRSLSELFFDLKLVYELYCCCRFTLKFELLIYSVIYLKWNLFCCIIRWLICIITFDLFASFIWYTVVGWIKQQKSLLCSALPRRLDRLPFYHHFRICFGVSIGKMCLCWFLYFLWELFTRSPQAANPYVI